MNVRVCTDSTRLVVNLTGRLLIIIILQFMIIQLQQSNCYDDSPFSPVGQFARVTKSSKLNNLAANV